MTAVLQGRDCAAGRYAAKRCAAKRCAAEIYAAEIYAAEICAAGKIEAPYYHLRG